MENIKNSSNGNLLKDIFIVLGVLILIGYILKGCEAEKKLGELQNLNKASEDTLKVWKDRQGIEHAEKQILQTSKIKDFLALKTKDEEILRLQKEVEKYKNKLGKSGSVTIVKGETVIDTFYTKPMIVYKDNFFYKDSIKNKWIDWSYKVTTDTLKSKNNVQFGLKLNHEYAIINKEKSNGWFKKPTPFTEVVNYNPYSSTLSVTTYRVINDIRRKNWGIGPGAYLGLNSTFTFNYYLGVGVQYSIIRF